MADAKVKFGVMALDQSDIGALSHLWRAAEEMGFDSAWVEDHFMPPMGDLESPMLEGWTLLSTMAAQTTRLRVGTRTMVNSYRHPAVLANMAAALDVISGGRLELGIGAGWLEREYRAYGFPFPKASERIGSLAEGIQIMKKLWTVDRTTFAGAYYTLEEAPCEPKPIQKPHPTVWVGGAGEKLTLRVVARHADGWNAFFMSPQDLQHKLDVLAGHCAAVDRDPGSIKKSMFLSAIIDKDRASLDRRVAELAARRKTDPEQIAQRTLIGTPGECVERLSVLAGMGIEHFMFGASAPFDLRQLELIALEVAPALRA